MDTERFRRISPPVAGDDTVYSKRGPLRLPPDLSQWVAPERLAAWIQEEIEKLDAARPEVQEFLRMLPECRPKVILSLMLYAYATQVFSSEDLVEACHKQPIFTALCAGKPPFPEELEHFRRKHRVLLENILAEIFARAVREKYVDVGKLPPGLEYSIFAQAVDRLDTARHMDTAEE
jgi:hypothetical protein